MKIVQTKKVFAASKQATLIDTERILAVRQPYYSDFYLKNLEMGLAGEEKVLEFLELYGDKNWEGIRNIWLNDRGKFECDLLLLAKSGLHLFEIKHYNGHFVYENGDCLLNNKVLPDNPVFQTKRNVRKLRTIVQRLDPHLKVYGTLVFMGEHNTIEIKSSTSDLAIMKQTELKEYILKIEEADRLHPQIMNTKNLIHHLEKYEDVNSFLPDPLGPIAMQKIQKGIYCEKCQNFQVTISKGYIHCPCGFKENREMSILRAICEYSVLTQKGTITKNEGLAFINNQASGKYLAKIMNKHLKRIDKGKYTYYVIEPIPFHKNRSLNKSKT